MAGSITNVPTSLFFGVERLVFAMFRSNILSPDSGLECWEGLCGFVGSMISLVEVRKFPLARISLMLLEADVPVM